MAKTSLKVVKSTGLVPVRFDAPWGDYNRGEVGGVKPADAVVILNSKVGTLEPVAKGVETETWDEERLADSVARRAPLDPLAADRERKSRIEIPAHIFEQHHLVRLKLAAQIANTKIPTAELADATIHDELVRRTAAVSLTERGDALKGNRENIARDVNIPSQPGYGALDIGDAGKSQGGTDKTPDLSIPVGHQEPNPQPAAGRGAASGRQRSRSRAGKGAKGAQGANAT